MYKLFVAPSLIVILVNNKPKFGFFVKLNERGTIIYLPLIDGIF